MKELEWMGTSKEDLKEFPEEVQGAMGYALYLAQCGERHCHAKIFAGMGNAKVLEIVENNRDGTYRTLYTVELGEFVFVLHAFQKKSKTGKATPKHEVDTIKRRLRDARVLFKKWISEVK